MTVDPNKVKKSARIFSSDRIMKRLKVTCVTLISVLTALLFLVFGYSNVLRPEYQTEYNQSWLEHYQQLVTNLTHTSSQHGDRLVRIIHQSWKNKTIPQVFERYAPSWKICFPKFSHRLWTDEENRALIAEHYPWFLSKYDSFPASIYRADCARYFYLLHYGGIYTDLDNECLAPFEALLFNYSLVFGAIDHVNRRSPLDNRYVQNSFMYSRPHHPFWLQVLFEILHSPITHRPDVVTGPEVLAIAIHKYLATHPESTHEIRIYEGRLFNPLTWGNTSKNPPFCKPFQGMSDHEYTKCRRYYAERGAYVVQYHTHVWG